MADIKSALRNIPEKQSDEESASERQLGYLRSFGYFSERLIKDLGVWQASYLIEQALLIKEEGSANIDASQNRTRKRGGCGRLLFLLLLLFLVIVIVRNCSKSEIDDTDNPSESQSELNIPEVSGNAGEPKVPSGVEHESEVSPAPEASPEAPGMPLDLASVQYPAIVVTTERFGLLNSAGKETPIAVGTLIKIAKRSELGTLTMEIGEELFVGNESRLIGKVELKSND